MVIRTNRQRIYRALGHMNNYERTTIKKNKQKRKCQTSHNVVGLYTQRQRRLNGYG